MGEDPDRKQGDVVSVKAERAGRPGAGEPQPPAVDIYEAADGWVLKADMPGVSKEDVGVHVEKGVLTIEGRMGGPASTGRLVYRGFEPADYFRSFPLSDEVDREKMSARMQDGVLTVTLPKAEAAKTRRIAVEGE